MNEPITPADRVLPTEADVADALIQHETSGMCHYGRTCGTCDCGRSSLNAKGLAEQDAMELGRARAVLALFASQPTVAQVKAEAQGATYDTAFVRRCATDECYRGELLSARDFDRWLAQVKADAWDEGYGTGVHDERTAAEVAWPEYREPGRVNPYRPERQ